MSAFDDELAADERFERRLFWRQLAIVLLVAALVVVLLVTMGASEASPITRAAFALAVIGGPIAALLPGPDLDPALFGLAIALTLALLVTASITVVRNSSSAQLWLSLAYLGIVGLMRDAGDGPAGFLPLVILPAVWLALYGTRRQLLITLAATALVLILPWALIGGERYTAGTPRNALLGTGHRGAREPHDPAAHRPGPQPAATASPAS